MNISVYLIDNILHFKMGESVKVQRLDKNAQVTLDDL